MDCRKTITLRARTFPSPFGELGMVLDEAGAVVRLVYDSESALRTLAGWAGRRFGLDPESVSIEVDPEAGDGIVAQLGEYFRGRRHAFEVDVDPPGTPFQRRVWSALGEIPYGATISYGELAVRSGRPGAVRAAGRASAANPVPILVPCHRVIGADGSLTGYAGGIEIKRRLLELESGVLSLPSLS